MPSRRRIAIPIAAAVLVAAGLVAVFVGHSSTTLTIRVIDLPPAVRGSVTVVGAPRFDRGLTRTATFSVTPGTYRVEARAVVVGDQLYAPTSTQFQANVRSGAAVGVTVDYADIVPVTTKVLDGTILRRVVTATPNIASAPGVLTFAAGTTLASGPADAPGPGPSGPPRTGEILAAGASRLTPDGLLVRVISVAVGPNGQVVVRTEPAPLTAALRRAQLTIASPVGAAAAPGGLPSGIALIAAARHAAPRGLPGSAFVDPPSASSPVALTGINVPVRLGTVRISPEIDLEPSARNHGYPVISGATKSEGQSGASEKNTCRPSRAKSTTTTGGTTPPGGAGTAGPPGSTTSPTSTPGGTGTAGPPGSTTSPTSTPGGTPTGTGTEGEIAPGLRASADIALTPQFDLAASWGFGQPLKIRFTVTLDVRARESVAGVMGYSCSTSIVWPSTPHTIEMIPFDAGPLPGAIRFGVQMASTFTGDLAAGLDVHANQSAHLVLGLAYNGTRWHVIHRLSHTSSLTASPVASLSARASSGPDFTWELDGQGGPEINPQLALSAAASVGPTKAHGVSINASESGVYAAAQSKLGFQLNIFGFGQRNFTSTLTLWKAKLWPPKATPPAPKPPPYTGPPQSTTSPAPIAAHPPQIVTTGGLVGTLRLGVSTQAAIRAVAGAPADVAHGTFTAPYVSPYVALGYGCGAVSSPSAFPLAGPRGGATYCRTVYFLSATTGTFQAFFTGSTAFATHQGTLVGMPEPEAVRRQGQPLGCWGPNFIFIGGSQAEILITTEPATTHGVTTNSVSAIEAENVRGGFRVGMLFFC